MPCRHAGDLSAAGAVLGNWDPRGSSTASPALASVVTSDNRGVGAGRPDADTVTTMTRRCDRLCPCPGVRWVDLTWILVERGFIIPVIARTAARSLGHPRGTGPGRWCRHRQRVTLRQTSPEHQTTRLSGIPGSCGSSREPTAANRRRRDSSLRSGQRTEGPNRDKIDYSARVSLSSAGHPCMGRKPSDLTSIITSGP